MPKNKGTNYFYTTRKLLGQSGEKANELFLEQLTEEERDINRKVLEISWMDADVVSHILAKAGKIIFPEMKHPLVECGRLEARDHLTGIYKIFLKFLSVESVMKQTAKIWKQYHDTGLAYTEKKSDKCVVLCVEHYPELTPELRDIVAGYCKGTIELTGAKNVIITIKDSDPQKWQFEITWQ